MKLLITHFSPTSCHFGTSVSQQRANTGSAMWLHCNDDVTVYVTIQYDAGICIYARITPICMEFREINQSVTHALPGFGRGDVV
jgi:hypothetical protein